MSDFSTLDLSPLRSADSTPILGTGLAQINLDLVAAHVDRALDGGRYQEPTAPLEYLTTHHCLVPAPDGTICATLAGLLCFGVAPQQVLPRAVVDIGHYVEAEPISPDVIHLEKDVGGTIFAQIERVETYLWANTHHGMTVSHTAIRRVEVHEYPRVVIRELTVNLLAHRDYTNFLSAARVQLFRNRIEWVSPGGLPPGITVENILVAQMSRNPAILTILYEAGYVEAFGQGLDTVVAVLRREGMTPAHFADYGTFFSVTVAGRPSELFAGEGGTALLNERQRRIVIYRTPKGGGLSLPFRYQ